MYYEVYIDLFFLENMIMDYLLLYTVKRLLRKKIKRTALLLAALVGAVLVCMMLVLPFPDRRVRMILGNVAGSVLMLKIGRVREEKVEWGKELLVLYLVTFCAGGIFQMMKDIFPASFFQLIIPGALLLEGIFSGFREIRQQTAQECEVTLYRNGKEKECRGFLDTGNRLKNPWNHQPVMVVSYEAAKPLFSCQEQQQLEQMFRFVTPKKITESFFYIPYHTIGKERGLLPCVVLDEALIRGYKGSVRIQKPSAALCRIPVSPKDSYEVILQPLFIENKKEKEK
ncbi:MAG: sigma-E processing peptidase SpoIIGA [Lachnospiraceae bacterium]|nr:sigma-E processing peptidase SpoIIGA [Robinsoniella sp.]MDY3766755.1 sigma-E processing peptidase SpoIIGA [Lachnospiraceae bacterium]